MSSFWNPTKVDIEPTLGYGELKAKWGIIVPHTAEASGAMSPTKEWSEYEYGLKLAYLLSPMPHATRDNIGVYGAAKLLVKEGCNCSIEPHLNAYNGIAEGFEILVLKDDSASLTEAIRIAKAFELMFPSRKMRARGGVKSISPKDRGGSNLVSAKKAGMKVALLSEAFFIDNKTDWIPPLDMAAFWKEVLV